MVSNAGRWWLITALACILCVVAAGCGSPSGGPAAELALKTSSTDEPETLDPHKTVMRGSHRVIDHILDRLVYIGSDKLPHPWVAESWEVADGGKTITFNIRQGIKFHDGTPLNAEAVAFTFNRLIDPETASPAKAQIGTLDNVEATGEYEVVFRFSAPYAPVWTALAQPVMGIISPTAVAKYGDDFGRNPVGSGPMKFASWTPASEIVVVRNDDYRTWREDVENKGPWHINKLVTRFIAEAATSLAALETGELNLIYPAPYDEIPRLEEDKRFTVMFYEGGDNMLYIEFNPKKSPFDDVRMRQAIGYSVDPDAINVGAYGGYSVLTANPLPPGVAGYDPEIGRQYGYHHDPDKARELMAAAGWTAKQDGKWYKGNDVLEPLYWTVNLSRIVKTSEIIQSQVNDVGFNMKVEVLEPGAFLQQLKDGQQNINIMKYTNADPVLLTIMFKSPGWSTMYSNPEVDALLAQADTELDSARRLEIVKQTQKVLLEDAAIIPLLCEAIVTVFRAEVTGVQMDAQGWYLFNDVRIGK